VRFFFDNNLPPKLAKSLHVLVEPNHQVVHLKDRFAAKTTDETWMAALSKEQDWIIVSGDVQIRKPARSAGLASGGTHDIFSQGGLDQSSILDSGVEICKMLSRNNDCR